MIDACREEAPRLLTFEPTQQRERGTFGRQELGVLQPALAKQLWFRLLCRFGGLCQACCCVLGRGMVICTRLLQSHMQTCQLGDYFSVELHLLVTWVVQELLADQE